MLKNATVLALVLAAAPLAAQPASLALLGYHTAVPAGWKSRAPRSSMRLAEFEIAAPDGKLGSEVVVYFFGKGQGGTVDANLKRWKAQFSTPDGSPVPETITRDSTGTFPITFAEYRGTYARGVGMGSPEAAKPGQTLLAGIAETPQGTLFIQLFGTTANVVAQRKALMAFARGIK